MSKRNKKKQPRYKTYYDHSDYKYSNFKPVKSYSTSNDVKTVALQVFGSLYFTSKDL